MSTPCEPFVVSNDRIFAKYFQGYFSCGEQRMSLGDDDRVMPGIKWKRCQFWNFVQTLGCNTNVSLTRYKKFGDFLRTAL